LELRHVLVRADAERTAAAAAGLEGPHGRSLEGLGRIFLPLPFLGDGGSITGVLYHVRVVDAIFLVSR
jgi:hypothetical protein